jgi:SPP1 family predicted phage head-tail adaptor
MTFSASQGLRAGNLRHRVTLERQVSETDSSGNTDTEWEYVTTLWASIDALSVREMLLAQQVQSQITTKIVIRRNTGIDASCRLLHNGVIYNIAGVMPDGESGQEYMVLTCSAGLNSG